MENVYRRTIDELIARYKLEPNLRDIYVEGNSDQRFFDWLLNNEYKLDTSIYEISTVNIPREFVDNSDNIGNRDRVAVFSNKLSDELPNSNDAVRCIIDADFLHLLGSDYASRYLLHTDFSCLEMYAFTKYNFKKIFKLYFKKQYPDNLFEELSAVLQELFLVRLVKNKLNKNERWISFINCCKWERKKLSFDLDEFVKRLLRTNSSSKKFSIFISEINSHRSTLTKEPRNQMNGHDFIELLGWVARKSGVRNNLCLISAVEGNILLSIEPSKIEELGLFKTLKEWGTD